MQLFSKFFKPHLKSKLVNFSSTMSSKPKSLSCVAGFSPRLKVAAVNLNQWAMDFPGNLSRTIQSIKIAKERGCKFYLGPELQLSGYGCEDHFLETDTFLHVWQSLVALLSEGHTDGILVNIGIPIMHRAVAFNCNIWAMDGRILLIRPKSALANDGNYREARWFTAWTRSGLEDYALPEFAAHALGQQTCPIGLAVVECLDCTFASEMCEELWTPLSSHIDLCLNGVDIVANGSGSHHKLRKLDRRVQLIKSASEKNGSVYLYSNQQGCDGGRLYFDGCAMIFSCGDLLKQATQFDVSDVEVVDAVVDLAAVRAKRSFQSSRRIQSDAAPRLPRIKVEAYLTGNCTDAPTLSCPVRTHMVQEEIAYGPACWLWDYLRRSTAGGFYLPLSGGSDSSATCALVGIMTDKVFNRAKSGDEQVIADVRRVIGQPDWQPTSRKELCSRLFFTCYLGNSEVSGDETKDRAKDLASQVGATHLDVDILPMVQSIIKTFEACTKHTPKFELQGGTKTESLALGNIQARIRMVFGYMLAQLLPETFQNRRSWLLVLGSANVDETLTGYLTKYDCSAADINPIGGIQKADLYRFLEWAAGVYKWPALMEVHGAVATAELEPKADGEIQEDEVDLGMSYEEMSYFGQLRKIEMSGPVSMYQHLIEQPKPGSDRPYTPEEAQAKVKNFFNRYARNRHKATVLPPSYHAESYSPDDNRFDLRQFLYPPLTQPYETIEKLKKEKAKL